MEMHVIVRDHLIMGNHLIIIHYIIHPRMKMHPMMGDVFGGDTFDNGDRVYIIDHNIIYTHGR
jgi:hypothetical protein